MNWGDVLIAVVASVPGVVAFFSIRAQNRKTGSEGRKFDAEGTNLLVDSAETVAAMMAARMQEMQGEIDTLKGRIDVLEGDRTIDRELAGALSQQLRENGIKPVTRAEIKRRLGVAQA